MRGRRADERTSGKALTHHRPAAVRIDDVSGFVRPGDRLFVRCEGGPCQSRLELFPPRLEIVERGGTYVLIDEGLPPDWRYLFLPD